MTRNQISYQEMLIEGRKATEIARANLVKEAETQRSNKADENIRRTGNWLKFGTDAANAWANVLKGIGSIIPF